MTGEPILPDYGGTGHKGDRNVAPFDIVIRDACPEDLPDVQRLDGRGLPLSLPIHESSDEADASQAIAAGPSDRLWVAEINGRVIGTVEVEPQGAEVARLRRLRMEPEWLGHGIARRLVARAAHYARERGCLKLMLRTPAVTSHAAEALEQAGFQYVGDHTEGEARVMVFYLDLYRRLPAAPHPG